MTKKIKILCFDPGLTKAGWSLFQYEPDTGKKTVLKFGTLQARKIATKANMREEVDRYGAKIIALSVLRELVRELMDKFQPDYVAVEDAFYHPKRPNAFAALIQWITTVEMLVYREFKTPVFRIPTKSAKQSITGDGGERSKTNIQKAVLTRPDLKFAQKSQTANMCEHEADSIAIGYHFINQIFPGLQS